MKQSEPHVQTRLRRIAVPDATREPLETIRALEDDAVLGYIYEPEITDGSGAVLAVAVSDIWIHPDFMPEDQENFPVEA